MRRGWSAVGLSPFPLIALLAAGPVASPPQSLAQPTAHGPDSPVHRTLPRKDIYANLSRALGVTEGEAKALEQSTEDRGFPPREAVVLLLLAQARADHLIQEGKVTREQRGQAIQASVDLLAGLVERDRAGWPALVQKTETKVDLGAIVAAANQIIGFHSESAGVSSTVPVVERPVTVKVEEGSQQVRAQPAAPAATGAPAVPPPPVPAPAAQAPVAQPPPPAQKPGGGPPGGDKLPEPAPATTFPREIILKNVAKEFSLDEEMVNAHLTTYEQEMPIREGVLVFVVANELTRRQILTGEIDKTQRMQAFEANMNYVLQRRHEGVGWGDVGRLGELSGRDLNLKGNRLSGQ